MAGESAREVARARRAKAQSLERMADAFERGAEGEEHTAKALAGLPDGWIVLHDIAWPGRPYANIDHVVVGPGGVFVIDSKNWSGDITIRDGVLRQNGRVRAAGVDGVLQAAREVGLLAQPINQKLLYAVLCFVSGEPLAGKLGKAMVCTQASIVELLTSRPAMLDAEQIRRVASVLAERTVPASTPRARRSRSASRPKRMAASGRPTRKGTPPPGLARLAIGLVAAAVLLFKPEIVTSAANAFSQMFVGIVSPDPIEPSEAPSPKQPHRSRS